MSKLIENTLNECCIKNRRCINSRLWDDYTSRRYECKTCSKRWTTIEVFVSDSENSRCKDLKNELLKKIGADDNSQIMLITRLIDDISVLREVLIDTCVKNLIKK